MTESKPLVSCVMPTANRPEMARRAVRSFFEQDYENKYLIVMVDDISDCDTSGIQPHGWFRTINRRGKDIPLGQKRNRINGFAPSGSLIMHWDDDDWYRSDRISLQVEALGDADICGLSRHLFYKPETDETWLYTYPETQRPWLAGGTCLYRRELWERYPFRDVQVGSDTQWMWGWPEVDYTQTNWPPIEYRGIGVKMRAIFDYSWYVATIHENNTSKKIIQEAEWKKWSGDIHALMNDRARVQIV